MQEYYDITVAGVHRRLQMCIRDRDEGVLRLAAAEAYGHKSGARDLRNVLRRRVEAPICTLLAGCPEQPPAPILAEEKDGEIVLVTA